MGVEGKGGGGIRFKNLLFFTFYVKELKTESQASYNEGTV